MALPSTLRFEDLGRPGERVVGGAICFFEVVGKRAPKRGEWFASGAIPMAYKAKNDLVAEYLVVSEETAREIMREDYGQTVFRRAMVKTEPDRCYGIRVAYDRSMALGEMMVGEVTRGESLA